MAKFKRSKVPPPSRFLVEDEVVFSPKWRRISGIERGVLKTATNFTSGPHLTPLWLVETEDGSQWHINEADFHHPSAVDRLAEVFDD